MSNAVHRIVEQRASSTPDVAAIVDGSQRATYRDLNQRANALARELCASGLPRAALAFVRMPRSADLAVVLLAILKAGACYAWLDPDAPDAVDLPASFCVLRHASTDEDQYLAIDIDRVLRDTTSRVGPNLPVLTRGSDVACVLPDSAGRPTVFVPHATIAALPRALSLRQNWEGSAGALDLWVALMSGATLSLGVSAPATAAA